VLEALEVVDVGADEEGEGGAQHVRHPGRQHRDEGVLSRVTMGGDGRAWANNPVHRSRTITVCRWGKSVPNDTEPCVNLRAHPRPRFNLWMRACARVILALKKGAFTYGGHSQSKGTDFGGGGAPANGEG